MIIWTNLSVWTNHVCPINQINKYLRLYGMVEIFFLFESVKNDRIDKKYFWGGGVYWKDALFQIENDFQMKWCKVGSLPWLINNLLRNFISLCQTVSKLGVLYFKPIFASLVCKICSARRLYCSSLTIFFLTRGYYTEKYSPTCIYFLQKKPRIFWFNLSNKFFVEQSVGPV